MPEDLKRYEDALDEPFPTIVWFGTDEELAVVIQEALDRGEPWTEAELLTRQGYDEPPEDAVL